MVVFAGASGDFNPIHHDREHARDYGGLPDVILHGQCKLAFLAQVVTDWIGVEGRIKKLGAQYRGMDIVGDTVVSRGRGDSQVHRSGGEPGGPGVVERERPSWDHGRGHSYRIVAVKEPGQVILEIRRPHYQ